MEVLRNGLQFVSCFYEVVVLLKVRVLDLIVLKPLFLRKAIFCHMAKRDNHVVGLGNKIVREVVGNQLPVAEGFDGRFFAKGTKTFVVVLLTVILVFLGVFSRT